ncbi:FAD-binding oxidoreductase [Acidimangrovimonas sediminis]|uniref:FAD-binding oxidoreductase n=1 Tax=Acidimangrovimonas sediminis TaxID=2056283 RepID=UPI001E59EB27|nr:FAD-binding oxidoreductase [Acidimangrovimonas sediminis]
MNEHFDTPDIGAADPALLRRLAEALPAAALLTGAAIDPRYQFDRRGRFSATPRFLLRPGTTGELSIALRLCEEHGQPLVVHGGRTGLSGAHRIATGEAVLSTERLTALGAVDAAAGTLEAGAGVALQAVQEAAEAADLMFGVDIGARGSATIGGNVATNAGGIRVLRYGMFRAQVAGLEAVLADGTVLSSMRGLEKDNSGYDLRQLFIGSEGTLGVVSRVLLRLHPRPEAEANALVAVPSVEAAVALHDRLRRLLPSTLSAFELLLDGAFEGALAHMGTPRPLSTRAPVYVLCEVQAPDAAGEARLAEVLMEALEEGLALDAVVSQSRREFLALWALREACPEFVRAHDGILGCDVSVPRGRMAAFLTAARAALLPIDPATLFFVFGHIGDGNLHYVIRTADRAAAAEAIYRQVAAHGGSISAEHGIGVDKKPWLALSRSTAEIAAMRRLKAAFDPRAILNRGRIFD